MVRKLKVDFRDPKIGVKKMRCWELFETRCPKIGHTILMDNGWVVGEVGNKTNFSLVIASLLCLRLLTDYSKFQIFASRLLSMALSL